MAIAGNFCSSPSFHRFWVNRLKDTVKSDLLALLFTDFADLFCYYGIARGIFVLLLHSPSFLTKLTERLATRITKKKKLKINVQKQVGTRVVFYEEGNTLPPLERLATQAVVLTLFSLIKKKRVSDIFILHDLHRGARVVELEIYPDFVIDVEILHVRTIYKYQQIKTNRSYHNYNPSLLAATNGVSVDFSSF
ncbi:hypothetical protein FXO38_15972 [Capsicum annuum]|nr:hypothetical protein FXO37_33440 [Capsicum annuum]KAF3652711.1 hypothetical protein FXO38_15972 [Capsicum annuum]